MNGMNETDENITITVDTNNDLPHLQEPQWILIIYFVFLACGSLLNLIQSLALLKSRNSGTFLLILQISLVDVVSCYVAVNEIATLNHGSWFFATELCPIFKGSEILINSLTIYLLICFNFHVISLWNLHETEVKKNNKNPLTSGNNSTDDSNECLVTKQENSNRLVTIDYRKRKNDISILFPTIFLWIVSLSLSVPNFTLSSTLRLSENYTLCAVIDVYYGQMLQYSLLIFKIILPTLLLVLSLLLLIFKLHQTSKTDIDNVLTKKIIETRKLLILAAALSTIYLVTSFQRQCLHFTHIISYTFNTNNINNFKMPPLYNMYSNKSFLTYLAMLHYAGSTLRGLLCFLFFSMYTFLIKSCLLVCCKIKK